MSRRERSGRRTQWGPRHNDHAAFRRLPRLGPVLELRDDLQAPLVIPEIPNKKNSSAQLDKLCPLRLFRPTYFVFYHMFQTINDNDVSVAGEFNEVASE